MFKILFRSMWNSLDILTYGLQVAISVMFFSRHRLDSLLLSGMLALQILLLFWKARLPSSTKFRCQ